MATQLVRFNNATRKFEVSEEGAELLRSLSGPVCILSICGRARQGKSYLLNQLVSRFQGHPTTSRSGHRFAVGSTITPCTKGLWLWTHPISRTLPNGQSYHLLLVDVEGIDAFDQTADYSNQVFSLALLLSSMLIYNQLGTMDESSVDKLASVCEYARLIRGRTDASSASSAVGSDMLKDLSPAFLWLLRDFQFQVTEDGRQLAPRNYMEDVLAEAPGNTQAIRAKNQMRASIKAVFPDRDCHVLVRPILDEGKLARMDSLPAAELRPEFKKGLDSLAELVLARCRPKAVRSGGAGAVLTGPALAGLAKEYCRVINQGQIPAILSTWQSVVQTECRRALDGATDLYRSRMQSAQAAQVGLEELEAAHTAALGAALELFNKQAVGDVADREGFVRRLRETAASTVEPLRQLKRLEAEARTTQKLGAAAKGLMQAVRDERADLAAAEAQLHALLRDLSADRTLGPEKYVKAVDFLAHSVVPELRQLAQASRAKAAAAESRRVQLEAKVAELTDQAKDLRNGRDTSVAVEAQLRRELAAVKSEAAAAAARVAAAELRGDGSSRELAALREQLAAARVEAASSARRADDEATRLRSELAAMRLRVDRAAAATEQAAAARGAAAQQVAARDGELAARTAELEAARRDAGTLRAANGEVRRQLDELAARMAAREATLSHLQQERDYLQGQLDDKQRRLADYEQRLAVAAEAVTPILRSPAAMTAAAAPPAAARPAGTPLTGQDPSGRKRDRAVAGLPHDPSKRVMAAAEDMDLDDPGAGTPGAQGQAAGAAGGAGSAAAAVPSPPVSGHKRSRQAAGLPHDPSKHQGQDVDMLHMDEEDEEFFDLTGDDEDGSAAGWAAPAAAGGSGAGDGAGPSGEAVARSPPAPGRRRVTPKRDRRRPAETTDPGGGGPGCTPVAGRGDDGRGAGGHQQQQPRQSTDRAARGASRNTPAGSPAAGSAGGRSGVPPTNAVSPAPSRGLEVPSKLDSMKKDQVKSWLLEKGFGPELIDLNSRRAPLKDYVALVRAKCGSS